MSKERVMTGVKKTLFGMGNVMLILFSTLCVLICMSFIWMFRTWPYLTMQELMFQIRSPMEGTSEVMIEDYIRFCLPLTLIAFLAVAVCLIRSRKRKRLYWAIAAGILMISAAVLSAALYKTWDRLEIGEYAENNSTYSEFIDGSYVDPAETRLVFPEQKRNLIYIFLESMETTYADRGKRRRV